MGIFDNDLLLPGVVTEIIPDYTTDYDSSQFGTTDSVMVIGTAFTGPVGTPVKVYSPEHASYVFGKVYDNKTKREATLVAGVKDAYDRGCRTIYAVRVGGKPIYKDFAMCVGGEYRLRVSGAYPTNEAKDYFLVYDNTVGNETIKIYKPASRATIAEKMQGLVAHENAVLVVEIKLNQDYGINRDSKLVDVIRLVNEHQFNNVLRLAIVDENGNDVTNTVEANSFYLGVIYPGIYFIGRNKSLCTSYTDVKISLVLDASSAKPYDAFDGIYFNRLVMNTDVAVNLPIYCESQDVFRQILRDVQVSMLKPYDFLETAGLADRAFAKDNVDYEEVDLSKFEIYKRLGSGFAITAKAERRVDTLGNEVTPRIKETPMSDPNRIMSIRDGIYSMLENIDVRYRVLTCGNADDTIQSKLPRPDEFVAAYGNSQLILNDFIKVTAKVSKNDRTAAKKYSFIFENITDAAVDDINDIYTDKVMKVVSATSDMDTLLSTAYEIGTLVMYIDSTTSEGKLYRAGIDGMSVFEGNGLVDEEFIVDNFIYKGVLDVNGKTVFIKQPVVNSGTNATYAGKEYVLGEFGGNVSIFQVVDGTTANVKPLGEIESLLKANTDKTIVYAQSTYHNTNPVIVKSTVFNNTTLEELVELLNNDKQLNNYFTFEIASNAMDYKDDYITDIVATVLNGAVSAVLDHDRTLTYDYNLYIPYKTTDTFARQLAQHCTYTELKTAPTHGVIGFKRLSDISVAGVAKRVDEVLGYDLDLYAKNLYGRNMLDRNNLPYPIGRNISLVLMQYLVFMDDGYRYISNGAAGYAGMVSTLPVDQSSTNQKINVPDPMYTFTNYQLGRLTQKGIVTVKQSLTKGIVVTDGITMAPADSAYRRLATQRIVHTVEEMLRQEAEPFIGKPYNPANRNALETAIKSAFEKIKGRLIEAYEFEIAVDSQQSKFALVKIGHAIVPINEIREVRNTIDIGPKVK